MSRTGDHGALMDAVYRRQRFIYDFSRKYFLLGRDHLIARLDVPAGGSVLEVACGTGRNLKQIARAWPEARLHGFDISEEMLRTARASIARAGLADRVALAQGDATSFDPAKMFGVRSFDRIVLSYCLSMIPDWQGALREAAGHLAPGGELAVVDFGPQSELPGWFGHSLAIWLAKFHVNRRDDLAAAIEALAAETGAKAQVSSLHRGYAIYATLVRPR
jgi:S-adenosylmethionine-diacylgycerolhomoserine-N-methlytransferase